MKKWGYYVEILIRVPLFLIVLPFAILYLIGFHIAEKKGIV